MKGHLRGAAKAILDFNKTIIDNTYDLVPATKLQVAYYEMYGMPGLRTLKETAE